VPPGNPSPKLAITVDPDVHKGIVAAAASEGVSISAWMTRAARRALVQRDGLTAIAEWESENGTFSTEEMELAHRNVQQQLASQPMKRTA
jgi:hypothetical protein